MKPEKQSAPAKPATGVTQLPWEVILSGRPDFEIKGTLGVRISGNAGLKPAAVQRSKDLRDAIRLSIQAGFATAAKSSADVQLQLDGAAMESRLVLKQKLADMGLELVDFLVVSAKAEKQGSPAKPRQSAVVRRKRSASGVQLSPPSPRASLKPKKR